MASNENIIKNMANEISRNCQAKNAAVETNFVVYFIDLLLLNPKYGKLFSKTINRNNLQYFVDECVNILVHSGTSVNTLKMQFLIQSNYDKLDVLIDQHFASIESCLKPLVTEILDEDPEPDNEAELKKLFRKISIYIILASGLGNPGIILTLKEGMAALESVFSLQDLKVFMALPRAEKTTQLNDLLEVSCGVRLFNRDCKKGGEVIPDLPFNLVDAAKGSLTQLSNSLIMVMQRVNTLSTAVDDCLTIEEETGNVQLSPYPGVSDFDLTRFQARQDYKELFELLAFILRGSRQDYKELFELLAFYRQYEVITRKLLGDVEGMVRSGGGHVDQYKAALRELHEAVKYKAAVPVATVFPLFTKLWRVWQAMQSVMYLVSRVSRLLGALAAILELVGTPKDVLQAALHGRKVTTDQDRSTRISKLDSQSLSTLGNYVNFGDSVSSRNKQVQYLGFCAVCLCGGALIPGNLRVGLVSHGGRRYAFCNARMATRFSRNPDRYINEVLEYARNNPHVINLLNIAEEVFKVKDAETLNVKYVATKKVSDKDVQTVIHPIEGYIEKNYTSDLWEWKKRACQWANIVNCQTHSTQTHYSHMRSEIHCQTYEMKDQMLQTRQETGVNTDPNNVYLWGLRGRLGYGQHAVKLDGETKAQKQKVQVISFCKSPCMPCVQKSNSGD